MKWEQADQLRAGKFRRLVGVSPPVFEQIREAAKADEPCSTRPVQGAKHSPRAKLVLENPCWNGERKTLGAFAREKRFTRLLWLSSCETSV